VRASSSFAIATMKSFHLDRASVAAFLESWPIVLGCVAITGVLAWIGWSEPVWRVSLVLFAGVYFGYVLRGRLHHSVADCYPHARLRALLSIGLSVATGGVLCRMAFPAIQGSMLDIIWLAVSFFCVLIFVLVNRRDPDVVE
jgi:hypothetical protein